MTARDSVILTAALRYAARGWPVFPCSPETKQPLVKSGTKGEGGLKLASLDEAQIREWWRQWPEAMIGMPTGEKVGVVVVDLDPRIVPADAMLRSLAVFCGDGALPACPLVRTQSGGLHLWFEYPALAEEQNLRNRAGLFAKAPELRGLQETIREHVDIRAEGGYVIVPPSRMASGARYEWEQAPFDLGEHPFPSLPPRLLDAILRRGEFAPQSASAARPSQGPVARSSDPLTENRQVQLYVTRAMLAEATELRNTPAGRRHDALNVAAFKLGTLVGARALSESVARAAIEDAAQWPGSVWSKKEIDTLDDGMRAGMAQPRDLSEIIAKGARRQPDQRRAIARPLNSSSRASDAAEAPAQEEGRASAPAASYSSAPPPPVGDEGDENPLDDEDDDGQHHDESFQGRPQSGGGSGGGSRGGDSDDEEAERHKRETNLLACLWLPLNDTGNAQRLLIHFRDDLLHVREVGWHRWTGTHWELEGGEEHAIRCAQRVAELIAEEADYLSNSKRELEIIEAAGVAEMVPPGDRDEEQKRLVAAGVSAREALAKRKIGRRKFAVTCGNTTKIKGMIAQAVPHCTAAPEDLDRDAMKFNVLNGTVHFIREREPDEEAASDEIRYRVRMELRPHDRRDLITKLAPATFDGAAAAPKWSAFLDRFQKDAAVRKFLQVYMGYALTGRTDEQVLIYNYGRGANGKSTFAEALLRLYGDYARNLNPEAVSGDGQRRGDQATPEIAQLPGARLVVVSELGAGQSIKENLVKALTGGERMQARHLNKGFFDFYPSFKAMMSGNDMPTIYGTDLGIWRRIRIVPWLETIGDGERRKLADVLAEFEAERSGILNWLLEGLTIYLTEGLVVPDAVSSLTASYRDEVDRIGSFLGACVTQTGHEDDMVQAKPLYEAFQAWCEAAAKKVLTMTAFGREMTSHGMVKKQLNGRLFYTGIVLHDVPARETSDAGTPPVSAYEGEYRDG